MLFANDMASNHLWHFHYLSVIRKKCPSKSLQTSFWLVSNQPAARCSVIQMLLSGTDPELGCNALGITNYLLRKWIKHFNPCSTGGPMIYKWPAAKASIKKLLERWGQSIDVTDIPKNAGKTTDIGTLFWPTLYWEPKGEPRVAANNWHYIRCAI